MALQSSPARRLPGVLWIPSAGIPPRVAVFCSSSISHVYDIDKDLHATTVVPPELWFQRSWLGRTPWAQGWLALLVLGKLPRQGSCRGRGGRPGKGLAGGSPSPSCSLVFLVYALP